MGIRQSVVYPMMLPEGLSLDQFCREIESIGYSAIELWFRGADFSEVIETAARRDLAIASMCGHQSHREGLSDYAHHERIEAELRESIDLAAQHGIPGVICLSGNRNPGQTDLEGMVACAHALRRVTPYAEEKGVNLNVEILNSKVDHAGYLCDRTDWAIALCEMVGSPRCKIVFDIYHVQIMEGDVIRALRKAAPWIGHYHTAGNPGRGDLDDSQELNYRAICADISATGYTGYVGHEFQPKGDVLASLRQAFAICDV
jgi:hydroxypyruvate isomerase